MSRSCSPSSLGFEASFWIRPADQRYAPGLCHPGPLTLLHSTAPQCQAFGFPSTRQGHMSPAFLPSFPETQIQDTVPHFSFNHPHGRTLHVEPENRKQLSFKQLPGSFPSRKGNCNTIRLFNRIFTEFLLSSRYWSLKMNPYSPWVLCAVITGRWWRQTQII